MTYSLNFLKINERMFIELIKKQSLKHFLYQLAYLKSKTLYIPTTFNLNNVDFYGKHRITTCVIKI